MRMSQALSGFNLHLTADGFSDKTSDVYNWALAIVIEYLDDPEIDAITPDDLMRFWAYIRTEYIPSRMNGKTHPLAGRSLENIWTAMRSFFGWCLATGRIKSRPDDLMKKPQYAEREVQPLSEDEIKRLLDAARRTRIADTKTRKPFTMPRHTALRDVAIICVFTDTGIRASELCRLTRSDIDFNDGYIQVREYGTGRKTKARTLPIGKQTRVALWDYIMWLEERTGEVLAPDDVVFQTMAGREMDRNSVRHVLHDIGVTAGIPDVHPHRLRHSFASLMAADDMSDIALMYALGHTTSKMARKYVQLDRMRKRPHVSIIDRLKKKR